MSDDDHKVIPLRITPSTRAKPAQTGLVVRQQNVVTPGPAVRPAMGVTVHELGPARVVSPTEVLPPGTAARPATSRFPRPGAPSAERLHAPGSDYAAGVPLFQWASVTVNPSDDAPVNNAALVNPSDLPIEINEVRFNVRADQKYANLGSLGVRLDLGPYPVTKDFVPLFNLDGAENLFYGEAVPYIDPLSDTARNTEAQSFGAFRWVPSSRLFLPPKAVMGVQFSHLGVNAIALVADVGYAGRVLTRAEHPHEVEVPYAASWVCPGINLYGYDFDPGNYRFQTPVVEPSTEQDLVNQAESAIRVTRLTGRFLFFNDFTSGGTNSYSDEAAQVVDHMIYVRLRTSRGYQITKGVFVPFRLLFSRETRCMETDFILEPGEYIVAEVQFTAGNLSGVLPDEPETSPLAVTISPVIGMVGERSVQL